MDLKNKIKIFIQAYTNTNNKWSIIKKVIKSFLKGGIAGLKYDIIGASRKKVNIEDIYDVQQKLDIVSAKLDKYITVIIEISAEKTDIMGTLESLNKQTYKNYYLKLIVPEGYQKYKEYEVTYYKESPGEVYTSVINNVKSTHFIILNGSNILDKNALYLFAKSIEEKNAEFTYCDECIFDGQDGKRINYFIKPDYSRVYNTLSMYIEQGVMFSTEKSKEIEHFFDENLKFSSRMSDAVFKTLQISTYLYHIKCILLLRNSFAEDNDVMQKTSIIERNLKNLNIEGSAYYKENLIHLALKDQYFKVSIIIPCINFSKHEEFINSILINTEYPDYEVIIVSYNETIVQYYVSNNISKVKFVTDKRQDLNYSRMCNLGAKNASGDILLFLNEAVKIQNNDWLKYMSMYFTFSEIGAISPKVLRVDNTIRYAGIISGGFGFFPIPFNGDPNIRNTGINDYAFTSREISVLSSTCIAIRKEIFQNIKGFNELDTPNKFCNVDLSFKVQQMGFSCFLSAESIVYSCNTEWYDSLFDAEDDSAYLYILKNYIDKLEYDPYFTEEMKYVYLKNIPYDNAFYSGHRKIRKGHSVLLVSHELSLTGAPVALHYAAKTILDNGDYPVVLSPFDGNLRRELTADGIDVIIDSTINGSDFWIKWARNFDLVIVSTLVQYHSIKQLNNLNIPVLWWIHESKESYSRGADKLIPNELGKNIHVFCGGGYAKDTLKEYRPSYNPGELLYCVPDYVSEIDSNYSYKLNHIDGKLVFTTIGTVERRKGQDVFAKAIMNLPADYIEKCRFFIIGKNVDDNVYKEVLLLKDMYPDQVTLINEVSRSEIRDVYSQSDAIVCASRDDPMPVFMTECLMLSKIAVCSENTGTASLLEDGVNGFVYKNNDFLELSEKMMYVIDNYKDLDKVKKEGRKTYETYFTDEAFHSKISKVIDNLLNEVET